MRIHITTTPSKQTIDFNHLHLLTGTIHKWFGKNEFHDSISLYSFSNLTGAKASKKGLDFPNGASFFISCWNNEQAKLLITGIQNDPEMFFGMKASEIILQENPEFSTKSDFQIGSPIYIQRNLENGRKKFYYFDDKESPDLLAETLTAKMINAGLAEDKTLRITFDQNYHRKSTKKIDYKKGSQIIKIRASWCPIIIQGKPETKEFAWNVGIGNSTGIGFGALK
ncbi:CRISPR-associated endoribonuclease Cas6 [Labilibaculum manganireducens]|uniref:CRISPR-associated endoribonuclease Cas6 n=1 Tax=Labilibaculum manganireducens TaxID=1940525 RepID=A0A2N3IBY1_9BACT|nr:CRISPR-associated endoribonuclease Cas6 [Labilibaculum manganireducens]PKQ67778.1 CRISPR-associated endoribonuclease Cas6 [Labilibaculum manganireducens]